MARIGRLIFDGSAHNADLYYLTGFLAEDRFLYIELDGSGTLYLSDLEVDRAKRQSRVDAVRRIKTLSEQIKEREGRLPTEPNARMARIVAEVAAEEGIDTFEVQSTFPLGLGDALRGLGLGVRWSSRGFLPARAKKSPEEVEHIRTAVRHTEAVMQSAIDRIAGAEIRDGGLYEGTQPLTAEQVRLQILSELMERNCAGHTPIVAGGEQSVDPHERGSGALPAHLPIILDIFPQDLATRYHGDMTRTVVRGTASDEVKRMFDAVAAAKQAAEDHVRAGVPAKEVHGQCTRVFEDAGFETGIRDGRMVGFFHSTGHGLGLDVHEAPRVGPGEGLLEEGHVVTIEPGLYYPGLGGVRLEDDVLVTQDGCENLCTLPSVLEV